MAKRPTVPQPKPITSKLVEANRKANEQEEAPKVLSELQAEVSSEAVPLWDFVQNNAKLIAIAVVAIIIIVMAFGLYQWNQDSRKEDAQAELGLLSAVQNPEQRATRLAAFAADAPKDVRVAAYMETAQAANQAEDWTLAEQAYSEIIKLEADSPLGLVMRMSRADALLSQDKPTEALADLEYVRMRVSDEVRSGIDELIAEAAEQAGQPQRAIEALQACIARIDPSTQQDLEVINYFNWRINRLQAN